MADRQEKNILSYWIKGEKDVGSFFFRNLSY